MNLEQFFSTHRSAALAFSGGVDSAYLLYAALHYGCDVHAYYVKSAFQPDFETEDAIKLCKELGARMTIIDLDILSDDTICSNPDNRCYHCKKKIFSSILNAAKKDGYAVLLDGTNASDEASVRPGMKVLQELQVLSPLRECGLPKEEIRNLSKEAELFTWEKPAYACLATRIPTGTPITLEKLQTTEQAESYLAGLGFTDFRIRMQGRDAKIQIREHQFEKLLLYRKDILKTLEPLYDSITLDLKERP